MAKYKILGRYWYSKKWKAQGRHDFDVEIEIDLGRFQGQYSRAQYRLDSMVMESMIPLMPMQSGTFINVTKGMSEAIAGSGKVVAAAPPMGRYLYYGKVMVDSSTGKGPYLIEISPGEYAPRFRKGAILKATERPLQYSQPSAKAEWFEEAKKRYRNEWVKAVKETAGGGTHG